MNEFIDPVLEANAQNIGYREGHDFRQGNFYICGHCGQPREYLVPSFMKNPQGAGLVHTEPNYPVWVRCGCMEWERERLEALQRKQDSERMRQDVFRHDRELIGQTFERDDSPNTEQSRICRGFAAEFDVANSPWLLLYGDCGRGKTYLAASIANKLIDDGHSVFFGTIDDFEELNGYDTRSELFAKIRGCDLLIVDDLKAERKSDYESAFVFRVIDTRLKSGRPCVITTNMTVDDLKGGGSLSQRRITSRMTERALPVLIEGKDRRSERGRLNYEATRRRLLAAGTASPK